MVLGPILHFSVLLKFVRLFEAVNLFELVGVVVSNWLPVELNYPSEWDLYFISFAPNYSLQNKQLLPVLPTFLNILNAPVADPRPWHSTIDSCAMSRKQFRTVPGAR